MVAIFGMAGCSRAAENLQERQRGDDDDDDKAQTGEQDEADIVIMFVFVSCRFSERCRM